MPLSHALAVLVAIVAAAVVAGVVWRARDGRRRGVRDAGDLRTLGALPDRVTLVQFSTETCARCPGVHRMLESIAAASPGVDHIEVDLTRRPELARTHRVLSTPTVFVVGPDATPVARFNGVPRRNDVIAALDELPAVQETR